MIKSIIKVYNNLISKNKFINFNKKNLNDEFKKTKKHSIILIEFNAFYHTHCYMSLIANFLIKKNSAKLVAFDNYKLTAHKFEDNFIKKLKRTFGKFFKLNFFKIYDSFGVCEFIYPKNDPDCFLTANKLQRKILKGLINKSDVLKIKIDKVSLGDLIYDGFLKFFSIETIDINSYKFKKYLLEFIIIYLFWKKYLNKNKVESIIGVHDHYAYGIIYRIAINKKIEIFTTMNGKIFRLDKNNLFNESDYKYYKKNFSNLSRQQKQKSRKLAHKIIKKRFEGKIGENIKELTTTKSAFGKRYNNKVNILNKNKKIKILIATHQLGDTCNYWGRNFFPDFYEWLKFLSKLAKESNYEWYIKDHPYYSDLKYAKSLDRTSKLTRKLVKENKNLIHLPSNISHHQIINEKIDFVLTIYGTIAFEYAYFNIPVILATKNCPFYDSNINVTPSNIKEYKRILMNLKNTKVKIKKNDVLDYFFMRYVYNDYDIFFRKHGDFLKTKKNWDDYDTVKFYDYWVNSIGSNELKEMYENFDNFYQSKEHALNLSHNQKLFNRTFL